jgi:hypothetical protein
VHAAVVFVPLTALGATAIAVSTRLRDRFGWLVVAAGIVALGAVQLALWTGEPLEESLPETALIQQHAELAEPLRPLVAALLLAVLAVMWLRRRPLGRRPPVRLGVAIVAVALAAASAGWVVSVGHLGARAVWETTRVAAE